jgi:hypothetical protein
LGIALHDARLVRVRAIDQNLDFCPAQMPAPGKIGLDAQHSIHRSVEHLRIRLGHRVNHRHPEIRRKPESANERGAVCGVVFVNHGDGNVVDIEREPVAEE